MSDQKPPSAMGKGLQRILVWIVAFAIAYVAYYFLNTYVLSGL